jgi:cytohesin
MAEEAAAMPAVMRPALWIAALNGEAEKVRHLIASANIEEKGGRNGYTPLLVCAHNGEAEVAQVLLVAGADVSAGENDGRSPLMVAAIQGEQEIVHLLLEHNADVSALDDYGDMPLHAAAINGDENVLRILLEHGADVSAKGGDGDSPLHKAIRYGNVAGALRVLLQHGAETSATNNEGATPLHLAAGAGYLAVVDLMLECGAEMGAATEAGEEVVRLLMDRGADLSAQDCLGKTPMEVATSFSHLQIAAMIKAEAIRRAQCRAFAMGQQARLGEGSAVQGLEAGVVQMVLEHV